jgi:hypothetical protein
MDSDSVSVSASVTLLRSWPDEHVAHAYRLLAGDVRAQLGRGDADPAELAAARRDAERFGVEAMHRGLL